jgi:hypothetical protein
MMLNANVIAATNTATVTVSAGWKWAAVGIGLGAVVLAYVLGAAVADSWSPMAVFRKLVEGADGLASTSKFQWLLWLAAVVFVYVTLWVVRAASGNFSAISDIPANVMTVLGFSTGTMVIAKGIRVATGPPGLAPNAATTSVLSGLFADDAGVPALAKVQILTFTFIAVGIFLAGFVHQLTATQVSTSLPNIDASLLVLMGISQGGYLGKKIVTSGTPLLNKLPMSAVAPDAVVTLQGNSLGSAQPGSQLMMDKWPIAYDSWSDTAIGFKVPEERPDHSAWMGGATDVKMSVIVNGVQSNQVDLPVGLLGLYELPPAPVQPNNPVTVQGFNLGNGPPAAPTPNDALEMTETAIGTLNWAPTAIRFNVPGRMPGGANWPNGNTTVKIRAVVAGQATNEVDLVVKGP